MRNHVRTLFASAAALVLAALSLPAGQIEWNFEANNPAGSVEFILQRRLASAPWPANPATILVSQGTITGQSSRSSGTITASRSGNVVTASAAFFQPSDAGKRITWANGTTDTIAGVTSSTVAQAASAATTAAGTFTLATDRVKLVDAGVPPGVWVGRVAARTLDGTKLSAFTNEATIEVAPYGPGSLQAVELGALINVSTRGRMGEGGEALIAGFVVERGPRTFLVRGIGPSLAQFGLPDTIAAPRIRLISGAREIAQNEGWADRLELALAARQVNAFALLPGSEDAALLITLPPGQYTAIADPVAGARGGLGLVEVYQVN